MENQLQNNNQMQHKRLHLFASKLLFAMLFWGAMSFKVQAQAPTCTLDNIGMYRWYGDSDNTNVGDSSSDDEDGDDFITYKNYGSSSVDISGWQLFVDQKGTGSPVYTFPSGTILAPGQIVTVIGDWNAGPALPSGWHDANFNNGEGLFEETSNNVSYAILKNPTSNTYITTHQMNTPPTISGTNVCSQDFRSLVPNDFEGCEIIYFDDATSTYKESTDCNLQIQNICNSGTTAPTLSATSKTNTCPATTIDLTTITATNQPAGTTLTWHTATPATSANQVKAGNPVTNPTAVPAGTYYAAFFDVSNNCFSGTPSGSATRAVTASTVSCTGPLAANNPSPKTAVTGTPISGNAATELAPTGGTAPYVYSNGIGDPACMGVSGATVLPTANLTITNAATGAYTVTPPTTPGTYYYCIKVCDSATPTAACVVKTYTLTVTAACNAGNTAPILIKN